MIKESLIFENDFEGEEKSRIQFHQPFSEYSAGFPF